MKMLGRYWKWCETADREVYAAVCLAFGAMMGAAAVGALWLATL